MNTVNNKSIFEVYASKLFFILGAAFIPLLATLYISEKVNFEPTIIYSFLIVGFIFFVKITEKSVESPILVYLMLQFIFIISFLDQKILSLAGISLKPHAFVLGFSLLMALYYSIKYFNHLWSSFPTFRYLFIFTIFNVIFYFFHSSNFNISDVKIGYLTGSFFYFEDFSNADAKFIVFLDGICPIIAFTISVLVFNGIKNMKDLRNKVFWLIQVFSFSVLGYYLLALFLVLVRLNQFVFTGSRLTESFLGPSSLAPHLFLLVFIGLKFLINNYDLGNQKKTTLIDHTLTANIFIISLFILLQLGKTGIISLIISIILMFLLAFKIGFRVNILTNWLLKSNSTLSMFSLIGLIFFVIVLSQNVEFIGTTISNLIERFENQSSMSIRQVNWHFFVENWLDKINIFNILLGFGLGASRESIFFISAMQPAGHLVQTIHNHFLEVIYDYGMVGLFYFAAYITMFFNSLNNIMDNRKHILVKGFSVICIAILVFFFIIHQTDGIRVLSSIVIFCLLGIIESIKHNCDCLCKKELNGVEENIF